MKKFFHKFVLNLSSCRTCEHELKDFDPYLNMKQLVETLNLVMSLYEELDEGNTTWESGRADLEDYIYDDQYEESEDDSDSDSKGDEGAETKIVEDSKASEKDTSAEKETSDDDDDNENRESGKSSVNETTESGSVQEKEGASPSRRKDKRQSSGDVISCSTFREEAVALYLLVNLGNEEAIMNVLKLPLRVK